MDATVDPVLLPPGEEVPSEAVRVAAEDKPSSDLEDKPSADIQPLGEDVLLEEREQDGEAEFQDAQGMPNRDNNPDAAAMSIRPPEDLEGVEDEDGGAESSIVGEDSYDGAADRMATPSPVGSFTAGSPPGVLSSTQQGALKQLNEWNSCEPSLDTSVLDHSSGDEFKNHVVKIAESKNLSPGDDVVRNILDSLLPLVRERIPLPKLASENGVLQGPQEGLESARAMPVAKLAEEEVDHVVGDEDRKEEEGDGTLDNPVEGHEGDGKVDESTESQQEGDDEHGDGKLDNHVEVHEGDGEVDESAESQQEGDDEHGDGKLDNQVEGHEGDGKVDESRESQQEGDDEHGDGKLDNHVEGHKGDESTESCPKGMEPQFSAGPRVPGTEDSNSKSSAQAANEDTPEESSSHDLTASSSHDLTASEAKPSFEPEGRPDLDTGKGAMEAEAEAEADGSLKDGQADGLSLSSMGEVAQKLEVGAAESKVGVHKEDAVVMKSIENAAILSKPESGLQVGTNTEFLPLVEQAEIGGREIPSGAEGGATVELGPLAKPTQEAGKGCGKESELASSEGSKVAEDLSLKEDADSGEVLQARESELDGHEEHHSTQEVELISQTVKEHIAGANLEAEAEAESEAAHPANHMSESEAERKLDAPAQLQFDGELDGDDKKVAAISEPRAELETKEDAAVLSKGVTGKDSSFGESGTVLPAQKEVEQATGGEEGEDDDVDEDEPVIIENSSDLAALLHSGGSTARGTDTPSLGGAGLSLPGRTAGLGPSVPSLEPAPRAAQHSRGNGASASRPAVPLEDSQLNGDAGDGNEETREKLQMIRVKFLRLAHRLGQSAHNVVVAQVLYRLGLAEQLRGGRGTSRTGAFSFERASVIAEEQEAAGQEEMDFTCTIMLLGKTGVGKSATINSIFDERKSGIDAFRPATKRVQEITGTVHGIKLRVIDTPGLRPSFADQRHNEKIMSSVKRFIKKSPPDIVLYFDRLDMQSRDYGDLPLLRTITDTFGAAVWFNAIVVLTHASSAPPDGANGVPLSYEMFVAQRSHVVQQTIRQAAGDMRLMNPVSLVENHSACRTNRVGQRVLPNGQVWKPQLLLLCFASKILAEANSLLKLQDSSPGKPFGSRSRVPPLPFLLSSLLQSRTQLKLPDEQMGDEDESDEDLEEELDSDEEDYDDLPPFRRLTKDELALLDDENRKTYFEELDYREKLFQKKQWKEELIRRRELRKRTGAASREEPQLQEESFDEEGAKSAAVQVPMPDMALPPSFDSDNPSHRYRYLETASQWLVRPVLETHGWDHDSGYDGFNLEKMFVIRQKVPASVSGQITKDKKEANLQMECAASLKHGEGKVTMTGLDVQTIGRDLAYTFRSETRFSNFKRNKTTGGLAVTFLGDTVAAGMKLEDRLMVGRRLKIVLNGGAITGRGDVAYGGSLEATLRDKDYPIIRTLSTLGLSVMDWHGDLAIGGNLQSQFMLGKTMIIGRANLNNRGAGQLSIRASSSEQLQMALIGIVPLFRALIGNRLLSSTQPMQ